MSNLTGFAEACYDENSIAELEEALKLRAADKTDCENWKITPTQWRAAIVEALAAKREDAAIRNAPTPLEQAQIDAWVGKGAAS